MNENSISSDTTEVNTEEIENQYVFFPNDPEKLDFVMAIYEQEILNRNKWIVVSVENINIELNSSKENGSSLASIVINQAMAIINHAMLVLRLVDIKAIGARNIEKSKERAMLLHSRNNEFVEPPKSLRSIRNDYEHFEERLDEWATKANPNYYIDLNIGANLIGGDFSKKDVFRNLNETKLTFWNKEVDLQEVINWVGHMARVIIQNNPGKYGSYY